MPMEISIPLENKPGALAKVTEVLGKAGINLEGIGYATGTRGILRVVPDNADKALAALKKAKIERVTTSQEVVNHFIANRLEVAAGVKQQLEMDAKRVQGVRILPGRFMVINQAMASQRGKAAGARYVREFIEEMKASGFVAQALERHKVQGAGVAPPGDAR